MVVAAEASAAETYGPTTRNVVMPTVGDARIDGVTPAARRLPAAALNPHSHLSPRRGARGALASVGAPRGLGDHLPLGQLSLRPRAAADRHPETQDIRIYNRYLLFLLHWKLVHKMRSGMRRTEQGSHSQGKRYILTGVPVRDPGSDDVGTNAQG